MQVRVGSWIRQKPLVGITGLKKMIGIIKKTWAKMSDRAKEEALKLSYSERVLSLIKNAIA